MALPPDGNLSIGLLRAARRLIPETNTRPDQARLRRSISSSYYAMFHALARLCADNLVGAVPSKRSNKAWVEVYRGLAHSTCLDACKRANEINFPQPLKDFADAFRQLQEDRHRADYDPTARFKKEDAKRILRTSEMAIDALKTVPTLDKRAFATWVLITSHGAKAARVQTRQRK